MLDLMVNRRVLIVMEQGAEAKFLFCDHAADDKNFLATQVIEAYVGENASLTSIVWRRLITRTVMSATFISSSRLTAV